MKKLAQLSTIIIFVSLLHSCGESVDYLDIAQRDSQSVVDVSLKPNGPTVYDLRISLEGKTIQTHTGISNDEKLQIKGLLANTTYNFVISSDEVEGKQTFTTDSLPYNSMYEFELITADYKFPGKLLFHQENGVKSNQVLLLNSDGEIEWYADHRLLRSGPLLFTSDETIFGLYGPDTLMEMSLDGEMVWQGARNQGAYDLPFHHDIKLEGDVIYGLTKVIHRNVEKGIQDISGADTLQTDGIKILDKKLNEIWNWSVLDATGPGKPYFDERIASKTGHANSLFRDVDGHFLISFRNLNQIWKVHSETGEIIYVFGENGDILPPEGSVFLGQHYAHINPLGDLMIFDNLGSGGGTRALSFEIDEENKTAKTKLHVTLPKEMTSGKRGSAKVIEGDKLLFCSTISNNLVVTDFNGKILWNLEIPRNTYRVEYVESLSF